MLLSQSIRRILVLDDDPIMRDLLDALLSLEGYTIALAQSGEEALAMLGVDPGFDLVLTDVQMPGLEGEALALALREAIPKEALLIGMSGTEPSQETRDLFDAFISKPFALQLLRDAMEAAKTRNAARNSSESPSEDTELEGAPALLPPLDNKIFQSLSKMIGAAQMQHLFAMALTDIEKRRVRIVEAVEGNDLDTVHREAHAIKGSCGMIGAAELQSLAAAIEEGTTPDTSAIEEIPRACVRLQRMLETKLHTV